MTKRFVTLATMQGIDLKIYQINWGQLPPPEGGGLSVMTR